MKATAFDIVNHSKNEIEMCWRDEVLNKLYYTDEFYPHSQKSSDDDRTQSACSVRKIRYDDRLPVIYPPRKCQSVDSKTSNRLKPAEIAEQTMVPPSSVATKSLERSNIPGRDEHIKSVQGRARILSKEERMARAEITEKENGCKEEMERGLARLERTVRERAEAWTKIREKLKQCQKEEKSQRGVIDWDLESEIGALEKQIKHQKRSVLRKDGRSQKQISPTDLDKGAPKYIVKLHSPADMETSDLLYIYMMKNERCSEWDHAIVDHYSGQDLLRDHFQRYYTSLKLKMCEKEDALQFMTLLCNLYTKEIDLTEIRLLIAKDMDEKYKDRVSARIAIQYFHNKCCDGEGEFDSKFYDRLHGDDRQMMSVTIDYFVYLFHFVISSKVGVLHHILHPDAPIWDGKIPGVILQEQIRLMESAVAVVQKDLEHTVEMQQKYLMMERKSDMEQVMDMIREENRDSIDCSRVIADEQVGKQITKEQANVLSVTERAIREAGVSGEAEARRELEQRRSLPFVIRHLEELRHGFADLNIIQIIRDWIDSRKESGGTICVVIDVIDVHQMLETLLMRFGDITLLKRLVSPVKMHAPRGGRGRSGTRMTRWSYKTVPTLSDKPANKVEGNPPAEDPRLKANGPREGKVGKRRNKICNILLDVGLLC